MINKHMKRLMDILLFVVAKLREIYRFFSNKQNEKIIVRNKKEIKIEEEKIHKEVVDKKIKDLNDELGWK